MKKNKTLIQKITFLLLFNLGLSSFLLAQTSVGGGVFSNTTWTVAESPYLVTSDVVVFPNVELTIEPGVEIRFAADTRLELRNGDLFANGNEDNPIVFTLDSENPTGAPKWKGIENTSLQSESIVVELNQVVIEYAQTGMNYGAGVAERFISNAVFRYNDRGVFDGAQGYNWVSISDSDFLENAIGMEGRMTVLNSTFTNNEVGFANPHTFANINSGGRVTNCTFTGNDLCVGSIGQIITIAIIENSTFENNGRGYSGYWANVDNSLFTGSSEFGVSALKGEIQNSVFTENEIGLHVQLFNNTLSVHDNSFSNNVVGLEIDDLGAAISDNLICNNTDKAVRLTTNQPVDLNNNCWCTSDLSEIALMIEDAYDDATLGIATYNIINTDCLLVGLVYPGDANNNGVVNAWDLLQIGIAYDLMGEVRTDASTNWLAQEATEWLTTFNNSVNAKHADTNGDGLINEEDVQAIDLNYNNSHPAPTSYFANVNTAENYELAMTVSGNLSPGETVQLDVKLANTTNPINDLYGIAFALEGSVPFFETGSLQMNTANSMMGNSANRLEMIKTLSNQTQVDIAMVKVDLEAVSGSGLLASFSFEIPTDFVGNELTLQLKDIMAITNDGTEFTITHEPVSFGTSSVIEGNEIANAVRLFPNPTAKVLNIDAVDMQIESMEVFDVNGLLLKSYAGAERILNVEELSAGIYFLKVQTLGGVGVKRFVVE